MQLGIWPEFNRDTHKMHFATATTQHAVCGVWRQKEGVKVTTDHAHVDCKRCLKSMAKGITIQRTH